MAYPVILTVDAESGQVMVRIPDVPEAITIGKNKEEALHWAQDALIVALSGYMDEGKDLPPPSQPDPGQPSLSLPALITAKTAIYQAMRKEGVNQRTLAKKLGCDARQVRCILDLSHKSRIEHLEAALRVLGERLAVEILEEA